MEQTHSDSHQSKGGMKMEFEVRTFKVRRCKVCNGSGVLETECDSEHDEDFCDCDYCGGTGVVRCDHYDLLEYNKQHLKQKMDEEGGMRMICFNDKTYCSYYVTCEDGMSCARALTREVETAAEKMGIPICKFVGKPDCFKLRAIPDIEEG